ncbi:hypothetical protein FOS14_19700 [Skermania sp. ID1734]|uniref:hypothetical protein n=1 Tax=Skermania sp. ID1734 TaxID=2597516 RepID=UPI00117D6CF9|nr:hypothetical protein [Skermania sp. ID1734]TSD94868.1 hypothetical protein FOS14_19700 [Skermania sp. ID1734]
MKTPPVSLVERHHREYLDGATAGTTDRNRCNDHADAQWYMRVTFDNLQSTRPHYVAGYCDAFLAPDRFPDAAATEER